MGAGGYIDPHADGERTQEQSIDPADAEFIARIYAEHYSGPMPPSNELSRYAAIDPTFPDRMMTMAE